jgi:uncharacterized protein YbjT (DUF2867 family)
MRIVVVGPPEPVGGRLVGVLRRAGHVTAVVSSATVVGPDLAAVLGGVGAVVDLDGDAASSRLLLAGEQAAGVDHHVALSAVGAERLAESGFFRAKVIHEAAVAAGAVPFTIVRATLLFEGLWQLAALHTDGATVRIAPALVRPVAAQDVAVALADVVVGPPVNGTVEVAGPEPLRLDDAVRLVLEAADDPRVVVADAGARFRGAALNDRSLAPGPDARVGPTRFRDWLRFMGAPASAARRG